MSDDEGGIGSAGAAVPVKAGASHRYRAVHDLFLFRQGTCTWWSPHLRGAQLSVTLCLCIRLVCMVLVCADTGPFELEKRELNTYWDNIAKALSDCGSVPFATGKNARARFETCLSRHIRGDNVSRGASGTSEDVTELTRLMDDARQVKEEVKYKKVRMARMRFRLSRCLFPCFLLTFVLLVVVFLVSFVCCLRRRLWDQTGAVRPR